MFRNRGIAFRLGVPLLAGTVMIFLVVLASGYRQSRDLILHNLEQNAQNLARGTALRIESVLAPVEKVPQSLGAVLENIPLNEKDLIAVLGGALDTSPDIFGAAVAFEPYGFDPSRLYFAPYLARNGSGVRLTYLGGPHYHYFYQDWYQVPRETGVACWSEPYYDDGGGDIPMATFSAPFYREDRGERRAAGVVTADISLEWLKTIISGVRILRSGYGFIISRDGTFVAHPEKRWLMNETIFSIAEARGDASLRELGRRMIAGDSGFVPFSGDFAQRTGFLYFTPIGRSRWSLGIFFPQDELMADLYEFNRQGVYLAACGVLLLILVIWLVSRTITRPLTALSAAAREMATGNLEIDVPGRQSGGEVRVLAESFTYMKDALKLHIQNLVETTAARERIESELTIARDIQMGLLPKAFPPFADIPDIDLYAMLQPAREVGGDLYDFYRIDETRICFVLGDVSGKGIPASLFMAVTMTLIKMTAAKGVDPGNILREVNAQLSRDNAASMFVTLFCGILDVRSGELWYANGGHNPPVLLRANGGAAWLEGTDGVLLGAMEEMDYAMKRIVLKSGDGLLLYSDGVTEAMDESGALYSEERLLALAQGMGQATASDLVQGVLHNVLDFTGAAPQTDDIAMMMVRYQGGTATSLRTDN
jgi:sigma-B regulation protein RsbU (phosphoserine phosphatase)